MVIVNSVVIGNDKNDDVVVSYDVNLIRVRWNFNCVI